jgi:Resolvase, N terminal domain
VESASTAISCRFHTAWTENELVRNILLATLSSLAKLEREKISQRTKAGLERARAMGKVLGRPKFGDGDREKLRAALEGGKGWHAASIETRISYSTVKKHARALGYERRRRVATSDRLAKPGMVRADPSVFTSPAIAFENEGPPFVGLVGSLDFVSGPPAAPLSTAFRPEIGAKAAAFGLQYVRWR